MAGPYSFIDIVVLEEVRARFAAGDALAILTIDLDEVIWANGAGAQLLGFSDVEAAMGASPGLGFAARRQVAAAPGFPRMARERPVAVRLTGGMAGPVQLLVSALTLADGVPAVLLAAPVKTRPGGERIIGGFGEAGHFAALLDAGATLTAASPGFEALGIAPDTLARLVADVSRQDDRLVKRLVPAQGGAIPAGIARLVDDPALHLLIAVDLPVDEESREADMPEPLDAVPSDADLPERIDEDVELAARPAEDEAAPEPTSGEPDADEPARPVAESAGAQAQDGARAAAPEPGTDPVRFSWRTDASGAFSAVSDDFLRAVGAEAAELIGRPFREVAARLGLDPDGEIAGLLERRDTWSGRSVLWPVAGAGRLVPVDLAALPAYGRDRVFDGFRGFGVARMGDAVDDPGEGVSGEDDAGDEDAPEAQDAGKVIRLDERRSQPAPDNQLSPGERSAFEQIRARLTEDYRSAGTPVEEEPAGAEDDTPDEPAAASGEEVGSEAASATAPVPLPLAATAFLPPPFLPEQRIVSPSAGPAAERRLEVDPDFIAGLPLPLLVHAGDRLFFANREFLALTGYADIDALAAAGGLDALFAEKGAETATGPEGRKLHLRTAGGEEAPVDAHLQSIRWRGSSALLLALRRVEAPAEAEAGPARDDLDVEELERRLVEMRTIIDTATDGVVLIDNDGAIRNISRPAEALFGFDSADVEGKPFASLFATESQRAARDYLLGLSDNGVASVLNDGREVIGREGRGRFIPLFMTVGRLPGNGGFCAVVRDITQWKRAEEELTQARTEAERASSQKTEFLARVSHEIRTPLNAIIGFSELMIDEKFGPIGSDRYRDYLRDINRSGNHVLDLVNDLLDISKIEAGEQDMHYEAVSLNDALSESVALMQPQANRERVIIRSSFASRLPDVVADLRSVRQIALNLLSNAIRYTSAGGQVIVSTAYEQSGDVVLRVRDTGIGMTLSEIDQALKPFRQINALKRPRNDGTGLGLPLTKAMVEANRARFAISSTPGEGTMVEITFPSTRVLAD